VGVRGTGSPVPVSHWHEVDSKANNSTIDIQRREDERLFMPLLLIGNPENLYEHLIYSV